MPELFDDTPPPCALCGERGAIPIIYGEPSPEMQVASQLGQIVLGGIAEEGNMPSWLCRCGHRYED